MRKIADSIDRGLEWSQPTMMKQEFELRAAGELVASLRFRSSFGSFATGTSGDGCWTFKRVGFWQQTASVRLCDSETQVALFRNKTWSNGGTLEFASGRTYRATTNFWSTKFEFWDGSDHRLLRPDYGGVFHLSARVEIAESSASLPDLPVLVLMSWYLAVMLHRDASAAGAAAAAG